jgi:hypothetical protein
MIARVRPRPFRQVSYALGLRRGGRRRFRRALPAAVLVALGARGRHGRLAAVRHSILMLAEAPKGAVAIRVGAAELGDVGLAGRSDSAAPRAIVTLWLVLRLANASQRACKDQRRRASDQ